MELSHDPGIPLLGIQKKIKSAPQRAICALTFMAALSIKLNDFTNSNIQINIFKRKCLKVYQLNRILYKQDNT